MRWIGLSLVFASLVLGAGGVATRPLADPMAPADEAAADAPIKPEAAAEPEAAELGDVLKHAAQVPAKRGTCAVATPVRPVYVDLSKLKIPAGFVSLNRTGYNYRTPGDPPQIIPDSTGTKKPDFMK